MQPNQTLSSILEITATHCCVCGKALTDTESVNLGIGPVCSRRYYELSVLPTEEEQESLKGLLTSLVINNVIPSSLYEPTMKAIGGGQWRVASNLLVYFASANYTQRDLVVDIARCLHFLGYSTLAEKLCGDRVAIHAVTQEDGTCHIRVRPAMYNLHQELRRSPLNRGWIQEGKFYVHSFPSKSDVEKLLSTHAAKRLVAVRGSFWGLPGFGVVTVPPIRVETQAAPVATPTCFIYDRGTHLEVRCPYNGGWINDLKTHVPPTKAGKANRTWDAVTKTWKIMDRQALPTLIALSEQYFGGSTVVP